jgi:hypothetical protein
LAVYHLRDALSRGDALDTALRRIAPPLLQRVDGDLYAGMVARHDLTALLRPVVANWFASALESPAHGAVASRLLDVFIVSHAAMPIYCAVAGLVQNRHRWLADGPGPWPLDSVALVELMLARALQYM